MVRLQTDYDLFSRQSNRLLSLVRSLHLLPAEHQKLVAEIAMMRLFVLFEIAVESICCKLCCGANYLDGSAPSVVVQQRTVATALHSIENFRRSRARRARWNDGGEIRENLSELIDQNDHCVNVFQNYASLITEMRYVRNRIAHGSASARGNFRKIVLKYYGAKCRGITVGTMLLSARVSRPGLIEVYIRSCRVLMSDLVKR
jgi:hypothetical protein